MEFLTIKICVCIKVTPTIIHIKGPMSIPAWLTANGMPRKPGPKPSLIKLKYAIHGLGNIKYTYH